MPSIMPSTTQPRTKLYFGFGSNVWLAQMSQRCPSSTHTGIARLTRWRWHINARGYANIVHTDDASDEVWGLVYALTPADEARLDVNEGVPYAYEKVVLAVDHYWPRGGEKEEMGVQMLVYVDYKRVKDGGPREEYVTRMNCGVRDALREGVPGEYVERVIRRYIPEDEAEEGCEE